MLKNFLRMTALLCALSVTSIAAAGYYDPGDCYVFCWDGTTAGPYWSDAESCCADFQRLCGGNGTAYVDYSESTFPNQSRTYCLS